MPARPAWSRRYARQLALPEIGPRGQRRLAAGRVLLAGAGGLGSSAAWYLAAAGVGLIGVADGDSVEPENLQRQILYAPADIGRPKATVAAARLRFFNPEITVRAHPLRLTPRSAPGVVRAYDLVVEALDNLESKLLVARVCRALGRPYVHAGVAGWGGQVLSVLPGRGPCLGCLFGAVAPVAVTPLGFVPGVIGALQAAEAVKYLLGIGEPLTGRLLVFDSRAMTFRQVRIRRRRQCPICGN